MFAFLETKPCLRGLIFVISSDLVNLLGTWIMFASIYSCDLKDGHKIHQINPSQIHHISDIIIIYLFIYLFIYLQRPIIHTFRSTVRC